MRPVFARARLAGLVGLSLVLAACGAAATPTVPPATPTVPPPTPVPTVAPRPDPEFLHTALTNMPALQSFTWVLTQDITYSLPDNSYKPLMNELFDRVQGVADVTNRTHQFEIAIEARGQTGSATIVVRDDERYFIQPDGSAQELPGESAIGYYWFFFQQGMWQPAPGFNYEPALSRGVPVTLSTPPSEVIDGVPTTHLAMDLRAMPEVFWSTDALSGTVEFWVDPQPPARVRRLALTAAVPTGDVPGPGILSPTEPVAGFLVGGDRLQLRRLPDGGLLRTVQLAPPARPSDIEILGFTADGRSVVGVALPHFYRWSTQDGHIESESPEVNGFNPGYRLSPDGGWLALGDNGIGLYRTSDWQRVATLESVLPGTHALTFSPDGRLVAALAPPAGGERYHSPRRVLQIWRTDGTLVRTQTLKDQAEAEIDALLFTADSRQLVLHTRADGAVEIRQVADGALLHTLAPAVPALAALAVSPDGRRLALASDTAGVYVWDLAHPTAEAVRLEPGVAKAAPGGLPHFSADGSRLLFSGKGVRVWAVADLAAPPVSWPLQEMKTYRYVWQWGHFNEPVSIPPLRLAPTATP